MSFVQKNSGGLPRKPDYRDFSHTQRFGALSVSQFPAEFDVGTPIYIKEQEYTDLCGGMGGAAIREDTEFVELSPEWIFKEVKRLMGDPKSFGSDPDTLFRVLLSGCLEAKDSPFTWAKDGRDFVANWKNWPASLDMLARAHKAGSHFKVDGPYNHFNNLRSALLTLNPTAIKKKQSILVGTPFYPEWNTPGSDGTLPDQYNFYNFSWHIWKIRGWKMRAGQPRLTGQLSQGLDYGEQGLVYFSENQINKLFAVPGSFARTFTDDDAEAMKTLQWGITQKMYDILIQILGELAKQLQGLKK